ncbi:MAG: hypothetical protein ABL998_22065, partial [Planctomycetota bacterium]
VAGTWPFLSCVVSCSGAVTQVDAQGMTDILDEYCPPGNRLATFTFGTTSGSWTSMSMDVREATDFTATQIGYNATISPNGDTLSANTAVVTSTWTTSIARSPVTGPGSYVVRLSLSKPVNPNGINSFAGQYLIGATAAIVLGGAHNGTTGSTPPVLIPGQFSLVCFHYYAQAIILGGGVKLSSALEGTTGTN